MKGSFVAAEGVAFEQRRQIQAFQSLIVPGAAALATCALLAVWTFQLRPIALPGHVAFATPEYVAEPPSLYGTLSEPGLDAGPPPQALARLGAPDPTLAPTIDDVSLALSSPYGRLVEEREPFGDLTHVSLATGPSRFEARTSPLLRLRPETATPQTADLASIPLPPRRPSDVVEGQAKPTPARVETAEIQGPTLPENRSVFDKLFGSPKTGSTVVAYANPEPPVLRNPFVDSTRMALSRYDKSTAVYSILDRAVYLPNGKKLEAHSGYGEYIDDPKHVDLRARGATPPATYELTLRESLFHGVQALRMKPIGDDPQFGRAGLLVHPYMLGPGGDSNGCVSVDDYDQFLKAFEDGQFKRLVVVARLQ